MFETHVLNENGKKEMHEFKSTIAKTAFDVLKFMPESRDRSLFITKLEEAVFFGAKAVAQKPENFEIKIVY